MTRLRATLTSVLRIMLMCAVFSGLAGSLEADDAPASVVDNLSFKGQADPDNASFTLQGRWKNGASDTNAARLIYSLHSQSRLSLEGRTNHQTFELQTRIHHWQ